MRRLALIAVGALLMGATVVGTLSANKNYFSSAQIGATGSTLNTIVLGSCSMVAAQTCTVSDTGVAATSNIQCSESGTTLAAPASFTGALITAGTNYVVNASASNSGTWQCTRTN
jgi:hypothetical protein